MGIEICPLSGAMGAEIYGVDLSRELDAASNAAVRRAFSEHIAIFFPGQHLSPADITRFVGGFGNPVEHPYLKPIDARFPFVHELRKEPAHTLNYGGQWHMDFTFLEKPSAANALYARETPDFGGDTLFANLYAAYDALSDGMKGLLANTRLVSGVNAEFLAELAANPNKRANANANGDGKVEGRAVHPLFRTIPETGRKCLFIDPGAAIQFEGMTKEESEPLIRFLCEHAERPEFQFRYRWKPDVFGIWDNRCCLHYALNDYPGKRRVMHRMVAMDVARPV